MEAMTLWQAAQVVQGWNESQGVKPPLPAPTREDHDRLMGKH